MIVQAKTLKEAIKISAQRLKCPISELDFDILQKPQKPIFGLFGKDARISPFIAKIQKNLPLIKEDLQKIFSHDFLGINSFNISADMDPLIIYLNVKDTSFYQANQGLRHKALANLVHYLIESKYHLQAALVLDKTNRYEKKAAKAILNELIQQALKGDLSATSDVLNPYFSALILKQIKKNPKLNYKLSRAKNYKKVIKLWVGL